MSTSVSQAQIEAALDLPCPDIAASNLSDVVEQVQKYWAHKAPCQIEFRVDLREFGMEGLSGLNDATMHPVKFAAGTHTCRSALTWIFGQTAEPEMTFVPTDRHIIITTAARAESDRMLESRIYYVGDLLPAPPSTDAQDPAPESPKQSSSDTGAAHQSNTEPAGGRAAPVETVSPAAGVLKQFGSGHGCGGIPEDSADSIVALIHQQTGPPARWVSIDGEGGVISQFGQYLAIRQTYAVHRDIDTILQQLRTVIKKHEPLQSTISGRSAVHGHPAICYPSAGYNPSQTGVGFFTIGDTP